MWQCAVAAVALGVDFASVCMLSKSILGFVACSSMSLYPSGGISVARMRTLTVPVDASELTISDCCQSLSGAALASRVNDTEMRRQIRKLRLDFDLVRSGHDSGLNTSTLTPSDFTCEAMSSSVACNRVVAEA